MSDQSPRIPDAGYVEKVLSTVERYPHGALLVIVFALVVALVGYVWKH